MIREEGEHKGDFAIRAQKTVGKGGVENESEKLWDSWT